MNAGRQDIGQTRLGHVRSCKAFLNLRWTGWAAFWPFLSSLRSDSIFRADTGAISWRRHQSDSVKDILSIISESDATSRRQGQTAYEQLRSKETARNRILAATLRASKPSFWPRQLGEGSGQTVFIVAIP